VGDPDNGHAQLLLQPQDQVDDLGLDGHIQGGGWLVSYQQGGVTGKGHGDANALSLPAGKLVRIILQPVGGIREAHQRQQFGGAFVGLFLFHAQV
jgi:hypothetical protein